MLRRLRDQETLVGASIGLYPRRHTSRTRFKMWKYCWKPTGDTWNPPLRRHSRTRIIALRWTRRKNATMKVRLDILNSLAFWGGQLNWAGWISIRKSRSFRSTWHYPESVIWKLFIISLRISTNTQRRALSSIHRVQFHHCRLRQSQTGLRFMLMPKNWLRQTCQSLSEIR